MGSALSENEREALSHFLAKVITDIEKVAALFESRGADASLTRAAQANLEITLSHLRNGQTCDSELEVCVPTRF
jgi:hypothetical protein